MLWLGGERAEGTDLQIFRNHQIVGNSNISLEKFQTFGVGKDKCTLLHQKIFELGPPLYRCHNASHGNPLASSVSTKGARNMPPSLLPKINFLICPNLMRNARVGERGFYQDTGVGVMTKSYCYFSMCPPKSPSL